MNKVSFYFILSITTLLLSSCSKNNTSEEIVPPIAYSVQYPIDIAMIEDYLSTNYITVTNAPGQTNDQDVVISKITDAATQPSIMSYKTATTYPKLLIRPVRLHDVDYNIYYLVLRPGVGESPCNVDSVLAAYRGTYLSRSASTATPPSELTATKFEESVFPQTYFSLFGTITGWSEIFPQFKSGTRASNSDGTISYSDFGAGVIFIPSGLAYYNSGSSSIPSYSPLVFSFKLYDIKRDDNEYRIVNNIAISEADGIPSYLEDRNNDGYMYDYRNTVNYPTAPADEIRYADDTDKDGIPDFLDIDDDGDKYSTALEIKNTTTGLPYPFAQIPSCTSGKKNYLDAYCHP